MRRLLMLGTALSLLAAPSTVGAQQSSNPIASLVGNWDLPGTLLRLKISPDGIVDHSKLGEGILRYDEASYYRLVFRQHHLTCQYDVRKYSENEVTFTVSVQPAESDCELGALRRSPSRELPAAPAKKSATSPAEKTVDNDAPQPGTVVKDCEDCPELVVVPAGRFTMGSPDQEPGRLDIEGPLRTVEVTSSFAVARYAITQGQFEAFVKATGRLYNDGCHVEAAGKWVVQPDLSFRKPGFPQDERHPVVCVNWDDASAYVKWLSSKTGKNYRLLTEAEREYVTRAGTNSPYWWGSSARSESANYDKTPSPEKSAISKAATPASMIGKSGVIQTASAPKGTVPVHLYQPNAWGLHQVHGNVAEWVEDCWNKSYMGAPTNTAANTMGDCGRRVLRGGGWSYSASDIRSAYRESARKENRYVHVGFRIARELT